MLIDIVSVFPEYFSVLGLSLLGKAQDKGLVEVRAHNLRDWTHDVHHSVDDTPVGGGAGMVMKPAVWAECLDDLLGLPACDLPGVSATAELWDMESNHTERGAEAGADDDPGAGGDAAGGDPGAGGDDADDNATGGDAADNAGAEVTDTPAAGGTVLIFPNPSAPLFTQRDATELSHAARLVFGCGRYEGYDARIPRYYKARRVDVREYSIGDYVLNGGEVAVSVMLEAITRLLPGFMGNPDSIVEESYTGDNALLEHLQYTKPTTWRGIDVPAILTSGDHGKVDRYRRDQALQRTSEIRPDLIEKLDCRALDKADRKTLVSLGWEVSGRNPRKLN